MTSAVLQRTLANVRINVHLSRVRRNLNEVVRYGRMPRKNTAYKKVQFNYAKTHINKLEPFWQKALWSNKTKLNLWGGQHWWYVWRAPNAAIEENTLMPTVKMICECFAAAGNRQNSKHNWFWKIRRHFEGKCLSLGSKVGFRSGLDFQLDLSIEADPENRFEERNVKPWNELD